jgi:sugar phosphate isomerase/epimerase
MPIHFAVCSELFADQPLLEVIPLAAEMGFTGLEISGPAHLPPDLAVPQVEQLAQALDRAGFEAVTLCSGLGEFAVKSDAECARDLEVLESYLALADALECDMVEVTPGGPADPRDAREDHWARATFYLEEACDLALGAGLGIILANAPGLTATVDAALQLAGDVDRPNLGLNYAPAALYIAGKHYGVEALERYGELLWNVRIGDASRSGGAPRFTALGEGELNLPRVLSWLNESEYEGYFSIGAARPADSDLTASVYARHEADALRHLLREARSG